MLSYEPPYRDLSVELNAALRFNIGSRDAGWRP